MEQKRGCGWRKVGGAYLIGEGLTVGCDALPIPLTPCKLCEFEVPFSRGMQMIHSGYLKSKVFERHVENTPPEASDRARLPSEYCKDEFPCPICTDAIGFKFALMFVSSTYYTPTSFISEARKMGVSKRIHPESLPKDFKLGETWVLLAHNKVPIVKSGETFRQTKTRAIFYAFHPKRMEIMLWKDTEPNEILKYEQQGFTVVLFEKTPENIVRHSQKEKPEH